MLLCHVHIKVKTSGFPFFEWFKLTFLITNAVQKLKRNKLTLMETNVSHLSTALILCNKVSIPLSMWTLFPLIIYSFYLSLLVTIFHYSFTTFNSN